MRTVVIQATNNNLYDYVTMATAAGLLAKRNMSANTILVTNNDSIESSRMGGSLHTGFDDVVVVSTQDVGENRRLYQEGGVKRKGNFRNQTRSMVYNLVPGAGEFISMDSDLFMFNDNLRHVYQQQTHDILLNARAEDITEPENRVYRGPEYRLSPLGIRMSWATITFSRRGDEADVFFDVVNRVRANWNLYADIYGFDKTMFRNDFAFSIARHVIDGGLYVDRSLPDDYIPTIPDFAHAEYHKGVIITTSRSGNVRLHKDVNVHCMNKKDAMTIAHRILGLS